MQREVKPTNPNPLTLRELAEVLVKHYGHTEGLFDVSIEFQLGIGSIGPTPAETLPGALVGVSRVGLARSDKAGPHTVDAAELHQSPPIKKATHKAVK